VSYLLYCIMANRENPITADVVGVDGQPVFFVSNDGLSAAVSRIQHSHISHSISWLLAYKQVVETFHNDPSVNGVIPTRYGCVLEEKSQVIRLLKERSKQYKALLKELEGCVEMGIRILISDFSPTLPQLETPWPRPAMPGASDGRTDMEQQQKQEKTQITSHQGGRNSKLETPGQAYLAARKAQYSQQDTFSKEMSMVINRCREAFAGLFVKCKTDQSSIINHQSSIQDPMLSLYFLVQKGAVGPFRKAFRHIHSNGSARLLLSGPWPPYNFVQPEYTEGDIDSSIYECKRKEFLE
jgi:hypothetical protein